MFTDRARGSPATTSLGSKGAGTGRQRAMLKLREDGVPAIRVSCHDAR
ncbi:MAG TPA: hypothetical protein VI072_32345 [Polyangiaceae bacterium]